MTARKRRAPRASQGKAPGPLEKAYHQERFLNSRSARPLRILAEYLEPESRFRAQRIRDTIVLFGSARARSPEGAGHAGKLQRYYDDAREIARLLTQWSIDINNSQHRFVICSGGGPGIMEAANRGAKDAGGISVGLGISLPMEQGINRFTRRDLAFEFHYFFMRKFWFVYLSKAVVIFPGGFGTLDELAEVLTLVQTRKLGKQLPVVIYGSEYWNRVINFRAMMEWGTISEEDLQLFRVLDTPAETFEYLRSELTRLYL